VLTDVQTMKNDQKKRGFDGFKGDFSRETPLHKPLRGMGSGRATGFSGFHFNSWKFFYLIRIFFIAIRLEAAWKLF